MQPFQCDLAPQRQETHRTTHTGTSTAAATLHVKNTRFRAPASSGAQHTACNIMQPCHNPMRYGSTASRNTWFRELRTQEQALLQSGMQPHRRNLWRPQPQPPHRRGSCSSRLHGHFTRKSTTRFRAAGSGLFLPSSNTRHATSCSHSNAIVAPQRQETHRTTHTGTSIVAKLHSRKRPQPQPPHRRGSFGSIYVFCRQCSHFTRKNTRFRAPASSPHRIGPCNIACHSNAKEPASRNPSRNSEQARR